jgi:type I restriction enzyme S subunit
MTFRQPDFHAGAWERKSIEEVCTSVTSGGTPSRKNREFYSGGTIPWIKTKELNDGLLLESEEKITEVALSSSSAKMLPKNTILLAMIGATVGKLGILGRPASCNQNSAALIVDDKVADYRFLFYTLLANREKLIGLAAGGAQAILSGRNIKQIEFLFPDLRTQAVIGTTLAVLDEKIQINNRLSKTLEDISQTIFKSWFIDFDPVKAKMAGEKPVGMDDATAALFPDSMKDSELGLIPRGWLVDEFGSVCNLLMGQSPPGDTYNDYGAGLPFYQGKTDFGARFPKRRVYCSSGNRVASAGETLISVRAPVGDLNQATEKCVIGRGVASALHKSRSQSYSFSLLTSLQPKLAYYNGEGTVFGAINKLDFQSMKVVEPSKSVLTEFDQLTSPINIQIRTLFLQTEVLAALRDSLLPRLISGELQIPEEMLVT